MNLNLYLNFNVFVQERVLIEFYCEGEWGDTEI